MEKLLEPSPTNRFLTTFVFGGIPSPLDIAFQKVSGLNRQLNVTPYSQGGQNAGNLYLADKVQHSPLILERGVMIVTPLTLMFDRVMQGEQMIYADVVILLLNHLSMPVCGWTLSNALPVRWQTAELDANANAILVNTLELQYQNIHWMGIKA
ncbi:phage tail protein [Dyella choica]|uniref:Phage tail protein n=1 Tax=Dyella choica TaxID=1927959 RepID=A0A3S0Q6H7_9GAMM|nr:phage tail protein [Dyella choica]RUL78808.1 phage tail protein [Dyella choica]